MPSISQFLTDFFQWLKSINQPDNWLQLGIIALALLFATISSRQIGRILASKTEAAALPRIRHLTLRSLQRIIFPLSALLIILIADGILRSLQQPDALLRIAVPLLLSLAAIRLLVYVLRKGFAPTPALKAWESIISTLIWVIVALYLVGWLPGVSQSLDSVAVTIGATRFSLLSAIKLIILIALLFTFAMWLSATLERRIRESRHLSAAFQVGFTKFLKFFLITLAILIALNAVGIDLTALTVFGGALGVGIGFGLQRIASNFISGFLLLFDRSIKPGDVISINNKFGWVEELRARYIVVRDRDGVETLIPNENLVTTDVINWSYSDRNVRLRIPLSVSYHDDPEQALGILLDAAKDCKRVLAEPEPVARLMEFGDNGIQLELRIWINDPENGLSNVRSDLYLAIWKRFKQANITIPFPQRDVYVKTLPDTTMPPSS